MRTVIKLFLCFLVATVLHWGVISLLGGWGIGINVMLIVNIAVCACVKPEYGYPMAFLCGLFLDFFGIKLFGHHALIFTLCATGVYSLENRLDLGSVVSQIMTVFGLVLAATVCNLVLLKCLSGFSAWNGVLPFCIGIISSAILAPAVFWAVHHLFVNPS